MSEKFFTILIMGCWFRENNDCKVVIKKINAFLIEADDYHSKKIYIR